MPPREPYQPSPQPQQHTSGQYEVLPPLPSTPNDGHSGHNPYDFIMSPDAHRAKSGFSLGTGNTVFIRLGIILGGVIVLFIIGAIIMSSLAPKGAIPGLLSIAERQQEIVRVSTEAAKQAVTPDGQNFIANVELSITSSQQQTLALLSSHGVKPNAKELALDKSTATDTELANAAAANNYDATATQNLVSQLQAYESLLQSTYKLTTSNNAKSLLQSEFNGTDLLLQQAKNLLAELQQ